MRSVVSLLCTGVLAMFATFGATAQSTPAGIATIAGGGPAHMPATSANLHKPQAIAIDAAGNYYVSAQLDLRVYKVDTAGTITVFAGTGASGRGGDGGPAVQAQVGNVTGIMADASGNVFLADDAGCVVRRVDTNGAIATVAGNGTCAYDGDGPAAMHALNKPAALALDSNGNLYIGTAGDYRIRKLDGNGNLSTIAGNGTSGFSGDGAAATSAQMTVPQALAIDASGNLYFADATNYRIRKVDTTGTITSIFGDGLGTYNTGCVPSTTTELGFVYGLAVDVSGNIYWSDYYGHCVREITGGKAVKIAGTGLRGFSGDGGTALNAEFSYPMGIALTSSGLLVVDSRNYRVRNISGGAINTVAGTSYYTYSGNGTPATDAHLYRSVGVTRDAAGNTFIADTGNQVVRKVDVSGFVTTVAGTPEVCGFSGDNGPASSAKLCNPGRVIADASGNLYIADKGNGAIRKVDVNGTISTVAGRDGNLSCPQGLAVNSLGDIFVADACLNKIQKFTAGAFAGTIAGTGTCKFDGDGTATAQSLCAPQDVALDSAGNLYVADASNLRIRKIDNGGNMTTVGGGGLAVIADNVAATSVRLNPYGVAVDPAGDLLVADSTANAAYLIDPAGKLHVIAGTIGQSGFAGDGAPAMSALLQTPSGISSDRNGYVFVADTNNDRIRRIDAMGVLNASASSLTFGDTDMGATSEAQTISLASVGPISIQSLKVTGDFTVTNSCGNSYPQTLSSPSTCTLSVTFTPTAAGMRTGSIAMTHNGYFGTGLTINLTGNGVQTGQPDLAVTAVSSDPSVIAGNSINVSETTSNVGAVPTAVATTTTYYLSSTPAKGGVLLGSRSVPVLAKGATSTGSITVVVPAVTAPGNYYVVACADDTALVAEGDETNNCTATASTMAVNPAPPKPDLTVTAVSAGASVVQGGALTVGDTTSDIGTVTTGAASYTRYYLSATPIKGGTLIATRPVPTLASLASSTGTMSASISASTPVGSYYVVACADDTGVITESHEDNNCLATSTTVSVMAPPRPDLTISSLNTGAASVTAGTSVAVTDTTVNGPMASAGASYTRYYLSATQTRSGSALNSRSVPALAQSAGSTGTVNVLISSSTTPGSYYMVACADDTNLVAESDETNNCAATAVSVTAPPKPDLAVTAVSSAATVVAGSALSVSDTTANLSASAGAGASYTRFYLSATQTKSGSSFASLYVSGLSASAGSSGTVSGTVPSSTAPGNYYVVACADDTNAVAETDETNNCLASSTIVAVTAPPKPDLTISSLTLGAPSVTAGTTLAITETTANGSAASAGASYTRYYLSTTMAKSGTVLGTRYIGSLAASGTSTFTTNVTVLGTTVPGNYYVVACADDTNAVAESDETNNCSAVPVQVN